MNFLDTLTIKVKRGESPFYRLLRAVALRFLRANAPVPSVMLPVMRGLFEAWRLWCLFWHQAAIFFLVVPLLRGRCASAGRNLNIDALPYIEGHTEIHLGDEVSFTGKISITSGRSFDRPRLVVGDRSSVGSGSVLVVNREVVIEEDVLIAPHCRIRDSDGHPKEADLRAAGAPPAARDIRPVRICRYAWIGDGCFIMKGVTIGEGAIIGANSVVISDIPPYCVAMGNPAEVYFRNVGRRSDAAAAP